MISSVGNLLRPWPELEVARDRLLGRDSDARSLGKEKLTLLIFAIRTSIAIPPDRMLSIPSAAAMCGIYEDEFLQFMADRQIAPVRVTDRTQYYRAGDIQAALEDLRAVNG
jgi:hypothetical protein